MYLFLPLFTRKFCIKMKNILFDLGGVILNIDYQLTEKAFQSLGIENFGKFFSQMKQSDLFDLLETGKVGEIEFCDELRRVSGSEINNFDILTAWNAMLLDLPKERLTLLEKLGKKYRLFLFSNTNEIHLEAFNKIFQNQHQIDSLAPYFEKCYYSHEFGFRKPHPSSFQRLLDLEGLNGSETMFIDDTIIHIDGAKEVGLITHHLSQNETIIDVFSKFI
jgi:FMN phosphatase YigB (HAD superfamily)